jgi:hypothetical protein
MTQSHVHQLRGLLEKANLLCLRRTQQICSQYLGLSVERSWPESSANELDDFYYDGGFGGHVAMVKWKGRD